jgi:hypothetical protein
MGADITMSLCFTAGTPLPRIEPYHTGGPLAERYFYMKVDSCFDKALS